MNWRLPEVIRTFEQEKWHAQHPVAIHKEAYVSVDGEVVSTPREEALGWIILRLNAQALALQAKVKELQETLDKTSKA